MNIKNRLLMIAILGVIVSTSQAQNAKKSFRNAKKFFEGQQYQESLTELNRAITVDTNYFDAYVLRAQIFEKLEILEKAASDYEKASALNPKSIDNFINAGRLNYQLKNYTKAILLLNRANNFDSKNFQVLQYKGLTHVKLNDYQQAIFALDKALQLEQTTLCFYARGEANDSLKNYDLAIDDYNNAIRLNPNFQEAFFALSKTYLKSNRFDRALEFANNAVQKFPEVPEAYEIRSLIFYKRGGLLNAINDLSKLETLTENKPSVLFTRGVYYFEYEHFQNAKSDFSQVLAIEPSNYLAIYCRGKANEELMENESAIKDFLLFLTLTDNNPIYSKEIADTKKRLFELNREMDSPIVIIDSPMVINQNRLAAFNNLEDLLIQGKITDQSNISSVTINGQAVELGTNNEFKYNLNISEINKLTITATDVYGNFSTIYYDLQKTDTELPVVRLATPFVSENGEIYIKSDGPSLYIEGEIEDASLITGIFIDGVRASFDSTKYNPKFNATISILNKSSIVIKAVDENNNRQEKSFLLIH